MLKQSQEHQMQSKVNELNDSRGQNAINQPSLKHDKQSSGLQYGRLNYGIRVRDPSQMFIFGDTNWVRGFSNPSTDSPSHGSASLLTLQGSQQVVTFRKSFLGNQSNSMKQPAVAEASCSDEKPSTFGLRLTTQSQSQRPVATCFDRSQIPPQMGQYCQPSQSPKSENHQLSKKNHTKVRLVSVKKEDDQEWSESPANKQLDAPVQKNLSVTGSCEIPSTSYATNRGIRKTAAVPLQLLDVANQNTGSLKSKKRKFSTFERLSWHKEVTEVSSRLHDISTAELEWAHALVRVPAKLKELAGMKTNSSQIMKRKGRLNLTTQLMQVLFHPPPAIILSKDAVTHCDIVTYYASKLTLGDACSLCSQADKKMISKSCNDQDLLKIIEGFMDRSKRLERDVLRLEKERAPIHETLVDSEYLERFSFMSRLAMFHGRTTATKPNPETHVIARSMPKIVPEAENCLFL